MTRSTEGPLVARVVQRQIPDEPEFGMSLVLAERRGFFLRSSAELWCRREMRKSIRELGVVAQNTEIHRCPDSVARTRPGAKCVPCHLQVKSRALREAEKRAGDTGETGKDGKLREDTE